MRTRCPAILRLILPLLLAAFAGCDQRKELLTASGEAAPVSVSETTLGFTFVRPVPGASSVTPPEGAPAQRFIAAAPREDVETALMDEDELTNPTRTAPVFLTNTGTAPRDWTVTSDQLWLTATPADGRLNPGDTAVVSTTVSSASLAPGTYTGTLTIADPLAPAATVEVPVSVAVAEPTLVPVGTPPVPGLTGAQGSRAYFAVQVPGGMASLQIATSGGTGNADVFVRYGAPPTATQQDCISAGATSDDSCTLSQPLAGTYYVMVSGEGAYSGVTLSASSADVPAPPGDLTAAPYTLASIRLRWTDRSSGETGFHVARRAQTSPGAWSDWTEVGGSGPDRVQFTDTGLTRGTPYQYRMRACGPAGCSVWVNGDSVKIPTTPPRPALSLTTTAPSSTEAVLTWTDGNSDEAFFHLAYSTRSIYAEWSSPVPFARAPANTTTHRVTGLKPDKELRYRIAVCNLAGCSGWVESNIHRATPPSAPASLVATLVSSSTSYINLTMKDGSLSETSFQLQSGQVAADGTASFTPLGTVEGRPGRTDREFSPMYHSPAPGTYRYRARACNERGCSAWTTSGDVVLLPKPPMPTSLQVSLLSATSVRLDWVHDSPAETRFEVYRQGWPSYSTRLGADVVSFTDTGLVSGYTYRYEVRACNSGGCSALAVSDSIAVPQVPGVPMDVGGRPVSASSIRVHWTDGSSQETWFELARAPVTAGGAGAFVPLANASRAAGVFTQVLYTNTGLSTGIYRYRVRSCNLAGCSAWITSGDIVLP
jgi:hypothetical protein